MGQSIITFLLLSYLTFVSTQFEPYSPSEQDLELYPPISALSNKEPASQTTANFEHVETSNNSADLSKIGGIENLVDIVPALTAKENPGFNLTGNNPVGARNTSTDVINKPTNTDNDELEKSLKIYSSIKRQNPLITGRTGEIATRGSMNSSTEVNEPENGIDESSKKPAELPANFQYPGRNSDLYNKSKQFGLVFNPNPNVIDPRRLNADGSIANGNTGLWEANAPAVFNITVAPKPSISETNTETSKVDLENSKGSADQSKTADLFFAKKPLQQWPNVKLSETIRVDHEREKEKILKLLNTTRLFHDTDKLLHDLNSLYNGLAHINADNEDETKLSNSVKESFYLEFLRLNNAHKGSDYDFVFELALNSTRQRKLFNATLIAASVRRAADVLRSIIGVPIELVQTICNSTEMCNDRFATAIDKERDNCKDIFYHFVVFINTLQLIQNVNQPPNEGSKSVDAETDTTEFTNGNETTTRDAPSILSMNHTTGSEINIAQSYPTLNINIDTTPLNVETHGTGLIGHHFDGIDINQPRVKKQADNKDQNQTGLAGALLSPDLNTAQMSAENKPGATFNPSTVENGNLDNLTNTLGTRFVAPPNASSNASQISIDNKSAETFNPSPVQNPNADIPTNPLATAFAFLPPNAGTNTSQIPGENKSTASLNPNPLENNTKPSNNSLINGDSAKSLNSDLEQNGRANSNLFLSNDTKEVGKPANLENTTSDASVSAKIGDEIAQTTSDFFDSIIKELEESKQKLKVQLLGRSKIYDLVNDLQQSCHLNCVSLT